MRSAARALGGLSGRKWGTAFKIMMAVRIITLFSLIFNSALGPASRNPNANAMQKLDTFSAVFRSPRAGSPLAGGARRYWPDEGGSEGDGAKGRGLGIKPNDHEICYSPSRFLGDYGPAVSEDLRQRMYLLGLETYTPTLKY